MGQGYRVRSGMKVSATPMVNMFGLLQTRIRYIREYEFSVKCVGSKINCFVL